MTKTMKRKHSDVDEDGLTGDRGHEGDDEHKKAKKKHKKHKKSKESVSEVLVQTPASVHAWENRVDNEEAAEPASKKSKKKHKKEKSDKNKSDIACNTPQLAITTSEDEAKDDYPYPVVPDDHCETPLEAYQHILPLLDMHARHSSHTSYKTLHIYDPYYCEGTMVKNLHELGFQHVYNKKEDFYAVMKAQAIPHHDVLITNPPYSQDHMEKLFRYLQSTSTPYCVLVPNYVYMKDYVNTRAMFFIVPASRYLYTTPKGRRQQKSAKYTSPFPSFWYCGNFSKELVAQLARNPPAGVTVATSPHTIPLNMAPDQDPRKKKLRNAEKRKKHQQRKKQRPGTSPSA